MQVRRLLKVRDRTFLECEYAVGDNNFSFVCFRFFCYNQTLSKYLKHSFIVLGAVYFLMKATIKNSKNRNGWRSGVYAMCAKALGYYNVDKTQSIYYEGDDLHVNILFSNVDNCHALLNALYDTRSQYYTGADIVCERTFQQINLVAQPPIILASDYVTDDFDSPAFTDRISFEDSASVCSLSNPTAHLLMLENPAHFVLLDVYDCHLMSVHRYPQEKHNPNNILRLSWTFHQYFDGLHTQGKHMVPLIAIRFVCTENQEQVQVSHGYTEQKYRVKVSIEAPDRRVLDAVARMLKAGSESNPDSDDKLYSFVYVDSDTDFQRCLTVKYKETKALWERNPPVT